MTKIEDLNSKLKGLENEILEQLRQTVMKHGSHNGEEVMLKITLEGRDYFAISLLNDKLYFISHDLKYKDFNLLNISLQEIITIIDRSEQLKKKSTDNNLYGVWIETTLSKRVYVEAAGASEAVTKVEEAFNAKKITLCPDEDLDNVDIDIENYEEILKGEEAKNELEALQRDDSDGMRASMGIYRDNDVYVVFDYRTSENYVEEFPTQKEAVEFLLREFYEE